MTHLKYLSSVFRIVKRSRLSPEILMVLKLEVDAGCEEIHPQYVLS